MCGWISDAFQSQILIALITNYTHYLCLCRIGEIEIMVARKEDAPEAAQKIDDIAKELGKAVILAAIQR